MQAKGDRAEQALFTEANLQVSVKIQEGEKLGQREMGIGNQNQVHHGNL